MSRGNKIYDERDRYKFDDYKKKYQSKSDYNERNKKRRYNSFNDQKSNHLKLEKTDPDRPIKEEKTDSNYEWGKTSNSDQDKKKSATKEKPNFGITGKLTEDTNKFRGVIIKYSEPPEARKPKRRWRLYPFKGEKELPILYIHRQSGYLLGRDRKIADIPLDHPSCSKQHAALQYRLIPYKREDESVRHRIRLYLMDLESANGTYINNKRIESRKYYELLEQDVIKFGYSLREYVLLHEHSKDSDDDDDVQDNIN